MYKYLLTQNKISSSWLPSIPHGTASVRLKKKSLLEERAGKKKACDTRSTREGKEKSLFCKKMLELIIST